MEKPKHRNPSNEATIAYTIILILVICVSVILIGLGSNATFSNDVLSCSYTSNRGLPTSRITQLPERFDVDIQSSNHITLYALDSSDKRVCYYSNENTFISLSPDGMYIAFEDGIRYPKTIVVISITGEAVIEVTNDLQYPAHFPIWSPDSEKLAFSYGDISSEVYIFSRNGLSFQNFHLNGGTAFYSEDWASWSPDSNFLAVAVRDGPGRSGNPGIYLIDQRATELIQLTTTEVDSWHGLPTWSDTGEQVSYLAGGIYNTATHSYDFDEQCIIAISTRQTECENIEISQ